MPLNTEQDPLISLVVPTFNRAQLLTKALESVASAVITADAAVEVVVVDNASTDETAIVVRRIASHFPCELRYVAEPKQGSSQARNCGLRHARGYYVAFMDDDQMMDRRYLKALPRAFRETGAVCVGGLVSYYNAINMPPWLKELSRTIGQINFGDHPRILDDKTHKGLGGGNIAFIRDELLGVGAFNEKLGCFANNGGTGEDLELQARMRNMGKVVAYHPDLIQYHYLRPERYRKNYWRRYFYRYGRSIYIRACLESGYRKRSRFPVPPWLLRFLVMKDAPAYVLAMFSGDSCELFRRELAMWARVGQISAARKAWSHPGRR